MSHDIRTPMNAIIGFTTLALSNIDDKDRVKDYLAKTLASSNHLLSLINDVLDMSRIESGKVKIEEKAVHLPDLIHDVRSIIQPNISSKRLSLFIDTMDVENEDIITDPLRLNQILLNLLSNAIKFTPAGGTVSVRVRQLAGQVRGCGQYEFRIKDNGIGMSPEFAKKIFEPFERERTSTVSRIQGTGLGMAITKNIVDMMGGTIEVQTAQGKGSEFIIRVPLRVQAEHRPVEKITELEGLKALVVDDDFNTCDSVTKMLVEPTAPSAVEPANRPTTATSDMLNKTCSRLDNASGRLTRRICFARGPSVRDLVLDFMLSFSFFSPKPCPRTPGHKLYYKDVFAFCNIKRWPPDNRKGAAAK